MTTLFVPDPAPTVHVIIDKLVDTVSVEHSTPPTVTVVDAVGPKLDPYRVIWPPVVGGDAMEVTAGDVYEYKKDVDRLLTVNVDEMLAPVPAAMTHDTVLAVRVTLVHPGTLTSDAFVPMFTAVITRLPPDVETVATADMTGARAV